MKKTAIRVLSVILCLVMMTGALPLTAFAQTPSEVQENGSIDFEATNSVGRILTQGANEGTGDTGYNIADVTLDGKKASVALQAASNCTLIVAIYSEYGQMLGSGIEKLGETAETVDVNIEIDTIPKYFVLQAFLLDSNNAQLCPKYTDITHTKEYEEFNEKTVDDFSDRIVLNFDEQKDDNFAVLPTDAVDVFPSNGNNKLVSSDTENGIYVFSNITSDISSLKPGDVFCYNPESEDILLLEVKSIEISGTTATIYENLDIAIPDLFDYLKINIESDNEKGEDQIIDMSNSTPGVEFVGFRSPDDTEEITTQAEIVDQDNIKYTKPIPVFKTDNKYLNFELAASVSFSVEAYFDVEWEWRWDIWNGCDVYYFIQTKFEVEASGTAELKLALEEKKWVLGSVDFITPVGITCGVEVSVVFNASASVELVIAKLSCTLGTRFEDGIGWQNLCEAPKLDWFPKLETKIEASVALRVSPNVTFLKIIGIRNNYNLGFKVTLVLFETDFKEDIHLCECLCMNGNVKVFFNVNISAFVLKEEKEIKNFGELSSKLFDFNVKIENGKLNVDVGNECTNYARKIYFHLEDKNGKAIENAVLSFDTTDSGILKANENKNSVKTDTEGNAYYYLKYGPTMLSPKTYTITAKADNYDSQKKYISVAYSIMLGETRVNGGKNSSEKPYDIKMTAERTATFYVDGNVYKTVKFHQGDSVSVDDPSKEGYSFVSWSPALPKSMPDEDMNFTAVFVQDNTNENNNTKSSYDSSTGTLTISGTGVMDDYSGFGQAPWDSYKDSIEHLVIESGVTGLGDYAFAQCRNLETVVIPDTVKEIGTATFYECNSLQTIDLPNSVETIDDYAFYNCYSMTSASLGSVETIGMYSFAQCTALKTVTIPSTTTNVGDSAFAWCQGMNGIVFLNKNCEIYQSANTIYTDTIIYGSIGSTAQKYANTYGRNFSSVATASVVDTTQIYDSYTFTCSSCVAGSDYILLNVTGYGNEFELTTSNLEFIDQLTADATGVISGSFIPRKFVPDTTTLLIGDFGNGIEAKKIAPKLVSTSVVIENNPGTLTVNFRESLKLTASIISPVEGSSIVWYVDGTYYCDGDTFEYSEVKNGMTVTAKLVDVNGNPIMKGGKEISQEETIKVNAGFFQKIIAFFKFTLFGQTVIRTN